MCEILHCNRPDLDSRKKKKVSNLTLNCVASGLPLVKLEIKVFSSSDLTRSLNTDQECTFTHMLQLERKCFFRCWVGGWGA